MKGATNMGKKSSWFEDNPRKTFLVLLIICIIIITFMAEKILSLKYKDNILVVSIGSFA